MRNFSKPFKSSFFVGMPGHRTFEDTGYSYRYYLHVDAFNALTFTASTS